MIDPYKFPAKCVGDGSIYNSSTSSRFLKALSNFAEFLTCYLRDKGL
jgi:hypothetical protein